MLLDIVWTDFVLWLKLDKVRTDVRQILDLGVHSLDSVQPNFDNKHPKLSLSVECWQLWPSMANCFTLQNLKSLVFLYVTAMWNKCHTIRLVHLAVKFHWSVFATNLNGFVLSYLSDIFARPHAHSFEGHQSNHPSIHPAQPRLHNRHPFNVNDQLSSGGGTTTTYSTNFEAIQLSVSLRHLAGNNTKV